MKTLKLRRQDKHTDQLDRLGRAVNCVWNDVNDLSDKHLQRTNEFISAYNLNQHTIGSDEGLRLHNQTIRAINETHAEFRKQYAYDRGWFELKRQLEYKCEHAGCRFGIVNERYTCQTYLCYGNSTSSSKSRAGLRIRTWTCAKCGTASEIEANASQNILAVGLERLAVAIPLLYLSIIEWYRFWEGGKSKFQFY